MKSLKLDPNTHKLLIPFRTVSGNDKVRQDLEIVLQTFYKEWFLDQTKGVKFKELVLSERYTPEHKKNVEQHFKSIILSVKNVIQIKSYSQILQENSNNFYDISLNFDIKTSFDDLNMNISLNDILLIGG